MVMLCSSTVLALTSSLLAVHVAAAPVHHEPYQRRAVDVAALIHNQDRPAPARTTPLLEDRAVNPEGFVPYMHYPSQTPDLFDDKRAVNPEGYVPYEHERDSPLKTRYYDEERVPFPRPVPQQEDRTDGGSKSDGEGRKRDTDPVIDNLLRKPMDVVPIVGRAVDPAAFTDQGRQIVATDPIDERAVDPAAFTDQGRQIVAADPIDERAVDVAAFTDQGRQTVETDPINERAVDPNAFNDHGRQIVDVIPIVGRAVDPTIFDDDHRKPVDVVPIVGRVVDPIVSENLHRKPVSVVPIVGRAVDVGALDRLSQACGPYAQRYDPTEAFCNKGHIESVGSPSRKMTADALVPGVVKRSATPEPQTDKMTCNGQRYLPSEQTCTANGSLVNVQPVTPHNSKFTNPPIKRAISQCGSGIGSVQYDRATEYCNPITQQVWPLSETNAASSHTLSQKPPLVPLAVREPVSPPIAGQKPSSSNLAREYAPEGPASRKRAAILPCNFLGKRSTESEPWNDECDQDDDIDVGGGAAYKAHARRPDLLPPHGVTKRDTDESNGGSDGVLYGDPKNTPDEDFSSPAASVLSPEQAVVPADLREEEDKETPKREAPKSPVKMPFWEYWYDDTYDSDVDGDSD